MGKALAKAVGPAQDAALTAHERKVCRLSLDHGNLSAILVKLTVKQLFGEGRDFLWPIKKGSDFRLTP